MALKQFTMETIGLLESGKAVLAFNEHLKRAALDCADRPGDNSPRVITMTLTLTPVADPDGSCDRIDAQFKAKSALPDHKTRAFQLGLRSNGMLTFNADSPEAVDQKTFINEREED